VNIIYERGFTRINADADGDKQSIDREASEGCLDGRDPYLWIRGPNSESNRTRDGGKRMTGIDEHNPAWEELLYVLQDIARSLEAIRIFMESR